MTNPGYLSLSSRPITIQLITSALVCALSVGSGGCSSTGAGAGADAGADRTEDGRLDDKTTATPAGTTKDGISLSPEEQRAGSITVGPPVARQTSREVTASAVLQMDDTRTSRVGAVVEGVVVATHAQVGDRVAKGARLAALHSHSVHDAWAAHRRALADVRRTTNELAFAKDAESRAQRLLIAKAASLQEAQRAQTDRGAAEEALVIARSEVQRALDELEHLGIRPQSADEGDDARETIPVSAPIHGVVIERLVTPGTAVTPGTPLYVVSDLSRLWAVAEIDEGYLSELAVGRPASLAVPAYPGRAFDARIAAIGDTINPDTRRVAVRLEVTNPDRALKPQMFATVTLTTGGARDVLLLPEGAVQKVNQQSVVFVETAPGRFALRQVRAGGERDGQVEILEGLAAHERVALSGSFLLKSKYVETGTEE